MNYLDLIAKIFEVCIIPLLGVLSTFLIQYLRIKKDEIVEKTNSDLEKKYLDMLVNTVEICVIATNQTYVNSLKEQGAFDKEAQKVAFQKTYEAVVGLISEEAQYYLVEAVGDLELYITQQIEAKVNDNKPWFSITSKTETNEGEPLVD